MNPNTPKPPAPPSEVLPQAEPTPELAVQPTPEKPAPTAEELQARGKAHDERVQDLQQREASMRADDQKKMQEIKGNMGLETDQHLENYSPSFQHLVKEKGIQELLKGSFVDGTFEGWEAGRRFIADLIDQEGTLLDFGCANGFLLKCLEEWADKKIDPYGIDTDPAMIEQAKALYPDKPDHFADATQAPPEGFPKSFDMIYWNVWDNFDMASEEGKEMLARNLTHVKPGGKMILGFYAPDKKQNLAQIDLLRQLGYEPKNIREAGGEQNEVALVLEVPKETEQEEI